MLYDETMKCLKDTTKSIEKLKKLLNTKPTESDKLTKEQQDKLQVELVRFILTVREFNK
jgi:Na+-translocating ferredoxin:NAD+ oxidoreductase RNF subunit RnfB